MYNNGIYSERDDMRRFKVALELGKSSVKETRMVGDYIVATLYDGSVIKVPNPLSDQDFDEALAREVRKFKEARKVGEKSFSELFDESLENAREYSLEVHFSRRSKIEPQVQRFDKITWHGTSYGRLILQFAEGAPQKSVQFAHGTWERITEVNQQTD